MSISQTTHYYKTLVNSLLNITVHNVYPFTQRAYGWNMQIETNLSNPY